MPEVGATLREARMRQRIDITDMEARTKIRAKYLRALENEEWDLLPGPTYVRSFLRTYADALGLDSKALVEEYKLRHDPLETGELHPIRRPTAREQRRRTTGGGGGGGPGIPIAAIVGLVLAGIVVALFLIGQGTDDDGGDDGALSSPSTQTQARTTETGEKKEPEPPKPTRVRLQLVPTAPVSVCLVDASGEVLIGNLILQPGEPTETFRSKRFRMVLGNNGLTMKINGRNRSVPPSSEPIAYELTNKGRRDLADDKRPTCLPS
jgi:cytoskeletal protein RodZ